MLFAETLNKLYECLPYTSYQQIREQWTALAEGCDTEDTLLKKLATKGLLRINPYMEDNTLHLRYDTALYFTNDSVCVADTFHGYDRVESMPGLHDYLHMCPNYQWRAMVRLAYACAVGASYKEFRKLLSSRNPILEQFVCSAVEAAYNLIQWGNVEMPHDCLFLSVFTGETAAVRVYVSHDRVKVKCKNGFALYVDLPGVHTAEMAVFALDVLFAVLGVYNHGGMFYSVESHGMSKALGYICRSSQDVICHIAEYFGQNEHFMDVEA